ncbi:MAG: shikimate dehydrogenase [Victivallales bacterium]|nr:shikimate dehydrogenase [Victivallales bacterium]
MSNNDMEIMKYAVIGDPITHSLSPKMHNAAFAELRMNSEYFAVRVRKEELAQFADFARRELSGFNVTVPHKNNIIEFLDDISEECRATGSVNTVSVVGGRLVGASTDGYGLEMALKEAFGLELSGNSFLFIGCGGTVQAVAYHFLAKGAERLFIANRTLKKAEKLARHFTSALSGSVIECAALDDTARIAKFTDAAALVIQATSIGLAPDDPSPFPVELMRSDTPMFDTIYKHTRFLAAAAAAGAPNSGGAGMLLHQGARSFEIWTGRPAPLATMKKTLKFKLQLATGKSTK